MSILLLVLAACRGPSNSPRVYTDGPVCQEITQDNARIHQVDDDIFVVRARLGRGSVPSKTISFIVTSEGVVAIDTSNEATAAVAKQVLREITDQPLAYIIYTHHHGTQVQGARALMDEDTQFIAHEDFPLEIRYIRDLRVFNRQLNRVQFNLEIPEDLAYEDPPPPDLVFAKHHAFELGGTRFELHHVEGEARDYTLIYLPDRRYVWVADLVNDSFPMVASPMKPVREPLRWKQAIDHIAALEPAVMINDVDPPFCDEGPLDELLGIQSRLLQFIHDAVVEQINLGATEHEAARAVRLPDEFAAIPQGYGSLMFAVRGVHHLYTGGSDENASSLRPPPRVDLARDFVHSMGGPEQVFARAQALLEEGEWAVALEYLDLLIDGSQHKRAYGLKGDILSALGQQPSENRILSNMYKYLGREARRLGGWNPTRPIPPAIRAAVAKSPPQPADPDPAPSEPSPALEE